VKDREKEKEKAMAEIEKNDLVGLTRDLNRDLPEGTVGMVTERKENSFEVNFPLPGRTVSAEVAPEDVSFITGTPVENEAELASE
jgi:hypothetical protein